MKKIGVFVGLVAVVALSSCASNTAKKCIKNNSSKKEVACETQNEQPPSLNLQRKMTGFINLDI